MTAMRAATATTRPGRSALARLSMSVAGALCAAVLMSGCSTGHAQPISASALAEVQTFPYFKVYWVGPRFLGYHLGRPTG